jgi:deoxyribonuclease IV
MILGVHVSGAGKIYQTLDIAKDLGCQTMQIFSRSPQSWRKSGVGIPPEDVREFILRHKKFKIDPVFIHISYLINLASPDPGLYHGSIQAFIEDIHEADALGADFIVTHMGSHKETSEDAGIKRLVEALNRVLEKTPDSKVGILLENTSGSGSWLGYRFYHQQKILKGIKEKSRLGLCLDTAHAFLSGYDLSTKGGLDKMVNEIQELVGIKLVKLIHLNDAAGELGCHHDRHAPIGQGHIGMVGMKRIINHPKLKNIPMVLETPKTTPESDRENLALVRKLRRE